MPPKKKANRITLSIEMDLTKPDEAAAYRASKILKQEAIIPSVKPGIVKKINALGRQLFDTCNTVSGGEEIQGPDPDLSV